MNNNYYVYVHKIADTGEIFYVGKGRGSRLTCKNKRSRPWNRVVAENQWIAEKHTNGLSEDDAAILEVKLIAELNPVANVQKKDTRAKPVNKSDFDNLFYYSETSKSGLRFKKDGRYKAGREAGTKSPAGYYRVKLNGTNYLAHRVVWALNNGDLGRDIIDHKDKNRSNNNISNLRLVTSSINNKNSSLKKHNNTGFVGVGFLKKPNIFTASWATDDSKQGRKHFSILKYGEELALALAVEYRYRKTAELQTYLSNETYKRLPVLDNYSEEEINKMFECDLFADNTSGIRGISFCSIKGGDFWWYRKVGKKCKSFSCTKYGNDLAKKLALEYKSFMENKIPLECVSEALKEEIDKSNSPPNKSGIRGLSFTGKNKDFVTAVAGSAGERVVKAFDTKEYGLLPAIHAALEWRENIKKEKLCRSISRN